MAELEVGARVKRVPQKFCKDADGYKQWTNGVVVYIHPKLRYHIVEFELPGGRGREAFHGVFAVQTADVPEYLKKKREEPRKKRVRRKSKC